MIGCLSKTGGNSITFKVLNNWTHRSVKIKTFKNWTAPNMKQLKQGRKYRLGTASNNYCREEGRVNRFHVIPTFALVFRRGLHN